MWKNYNFRRYDYNECSSKGICSISPNISSLQEIVLVQIKEIAYYVKKLNYLGEKNTKVEKIILQALSEFVSVSEYTDDKIMSVFKSLENEIKDLKVRYHMLCKNTNRKYREAPQKLILDGSETLSQLMSYGEKIYLKKIKSMNAETKLYSDLMLITLKSLTTNALKILDYNESVSAACKLVTKCLNSYDNDNVSAEKLKIYINKIVTTENNLLITRTNIQKNYFGNIKKVIVSTSTRPGKAILVSGSSLIDLYNFLEFTKNIENIDIYTHGDLLIAHAFEKFKQFSNLRGHYGSGNENCLLDFTTFPGTILLTKHSRQNLENIIRGRIFTMDEIQPKGATKIIEKDFQKVVDCANNETRGFRKGQIKNNIIIGFDTCELNNLLEDLKIALDKGLYKRILIIGMPPNSPLMELYTQDLVKELSKDTFIINFSGFDFERQQLNINIANNFPVMYKILSMLNKKIPTKNYKYVFYIPKCNSNSISGILYLKNIGADKIMLANCTPNAMNPQILTNFAKHYGINLITTPKNDSYILEK